MCLYTVILHEFNFSYSNIVIPHKKAMHTIPGCDLTVKVLEKNRNRTFRTEAKQFDIYLTVKIALSFYFYPAVHSCFVIN